MECMMRFNMRTRWPWLTGLICFLAVFASPRFVQAHSASITHVHVDATAANLDVTFQISQGDVFHSLIKSESNQHRFMDFDELCDAASAIVRHVLANTTVTANGETLIGRAPEPWPENRIPLVKVDSLGIEQSVPLSLTVRYSLPAGRHDLAMSFRLFEDSGLANTFVVNVRRNGAVAKQYVVGPGQPVRFDLAESDPAVAQTRTETPGPTPIAASTGVGFWATLTAFATLGFLHIIPQGYDHVLFMLGLFFLNPKLRTLLMQVTAFTVAHSLTLGLAAAGWIVAPPAIVEPLIAASIAFVAIENLLSRKVRPWRWVIVFAFGLVHGMGFAGLLHETGLPVGREGVAMFGFNIGVELGQLAVILVAFLLTGWFRRRRWYFARIAAPASVAIACVGLFWTVQRIFFG